MSYYPGRGGPSRGGGGYQGGRSSHGASPGQGHHGYGGQGHQGFSGHGGGGGFGGPPGRGGPPGGRGGPPGRGGGSNRGGGGGRPRGTPQYAAAPREPALPTLASIEDGSGELVEPEPRLGYGTVGRRVDLTSNAFAVSIAGARMEWHKYEINIQQDTRPGVTARARPSTGALPRRYLREIWIEIERLERAGANNFGGKDPVYDGGLACYTEQPFPQDITIRDIQIASKPRDQFTVRIFNGIVVPLQSLRNYLTGQGTFHIGQMSEALQLLNVAFRHGPALAFLSTRTSFFPPPDRTNGDEVTISPDFLKLIRGFFAAVRPCMGATQLVINSTSAAYLIDGSLSKWMIGFLKARGVRDPSLSVANIPDDAYIRMNRALKNAEIQVDRGQSRLRTRIRGHGLLRFGPRDHYFDVNGHGRMDVEEYLLATFQIRLRHPEWPLVEVRQGVFYPVELITIDPNNKYLSRLDPSQQHAATGVQIMAPAAKLGYIQAVRNTHIQRQCDPTLARFGISIGLRPKHVAGRIVDPPQIEYRSGRNRNENNQLAPTDGGWMMKWARGAFDQMFIRGGQIKSYAIIIPTEAHRRRTEEFFELLMQKAALLGMDVGGLGHLGPRAIYTRRPGDSVAQAINAADRLAQHAYNAPAQLLVYIFGEANSPDYSVFKFEAVRRGIASQALQEKKLSKPGDVQLAVNLCLKINSKLAGQSFRLEANSTSGRAGSAGWLSQIKPMVFGADLSHEADKPSVAVITATMHDQAIICAEESSVQALIEPPANAAPHARARKSEVIVNAHDMVLSLLKTRTSSGTLPPDNLLFLRDGISEGEYAAFIRTEVEEYRRAIRSFRADPDMLKRFADKVEQLKGYRPKITVVACIKGHHVRFFNEEGTNMTRSAINIEPGTIVDSEVTSTRSADMYMAAHAALIGTTRPTRYEVLVDENRLSADEFQTTMHSLCYTYQRCHKSVSLPAPVYYAHLVAGQVRQWILSRMAAQASPTGPSNASTAASRLQDFTGAQQILNDTHHGRHFFRASRPPAMWWM